MNTEEEAKVIYRAETSTYTKDQLVTLYENVKVRGGTARALNAIEGRLHRDFPQAARSMFSAREEHVMEVLTRLSNELNADFDFTANSVKNHIKTGGDEISGAAFLCRYLSYKNNDNQGAQITLIQSSFDGELLVTVDRYQTNAKVDNYRNGQQFAIGQFDTAAQLYREYLEELHIPRRQAA